MPTAANAHWFFRYKLYHIPFWFVYHYTWWAINIGNPFAAASNIFSSPYAIKYCFYVIFQALAVYFNLYLLIPRFLEKGKYVTFIALFLITTVTAAAIIATGYQASAWLAGKSIHELYGIKDYPYRHFFQMNTLPSTTASMTLGMCVKLTKNWLETKKREHLLQQEKLETELKFLRSQFNPHFLFNTINSIFVLIHKNPDKASASLAKFSELLRYQLYECNEQQIPLSQEITYLENFIELERLRQEKNLTIDINLKRTRDSNLSIAPFMLIPFVENAFKHVSKGSDGNGRIVIHLEAVDEQLTMVVKNNVSSKPVRNAELLNFGGLGLKNIERRLELIYPGKHTLTVASDAHEYKVTLKIELTLQRQPKLKMASV